MLKYFFSEPVRFESNESVDQLTKRIDALFKKTYGFNLSTNLYGRINEHGKFRVSPKFEFIQIKGSTEMSATMEGVIIKDGKKSVIEAKVWANWVFFLLALAGFIVLLYVSLIDDKSDLNAKIIAGLFAFIVPVLFALLSKARKNALVSNFAKAFKLKVVYPMQQPLAS
ncbi:MAG TPA: hypothetical protein PLW44_06925 [Chitinophagales bacterium]|nr:hypothetical protein [Chitinophagales bacterium]